MTTTISITIIEDDLKQAKILVDRLQNILYTNQSVSINIKIPQNYIQIYEQETIAIEKNEVFFIDIHLNTYFNGIDFARRILNSDPDIFIVYITSDAEKSICAINAQTKPFAYILKNNKHEYLQKQLETIIDKISNQLLQKVDQQQVISFSYHGEKLYLNPDKIIYVQTAEGFQKKTIIHTEHKDYMLNYRLIDIKEILPNKFFQKNLKSVIINTARIYMMNRKEGLVLFDDQSTLYVGSKVIDKLKKALNTR